jgi:hypothetical protein
MRGQSQAVMGSRARLGWAGLLPVALAGCMNAVPPARTTQPTRAPAPAATPVFRPPPVQQVPGVEGLINQSATGLISQFGAPRLDVHEGDMRKLQFTGQACVLDVFLYPLRQGGEPVATYVEARRASDGQDVDKASCVAALLKR